jgi:hypothetical protein
LRELFKLGDTQRSETQEQLVEIHQNIKYYPEFDKHIAILKNATKHVLANYSDHDVLFLKKSDDNVSHSNHIQSAAAANDSYNRLAQSGNSRDPILLSPPPQRKQKERTVTEKPVSQKKQPFSGNELDQLLRAVRMYGEKNNWGLINLEYFEHAKYSSEILRGAWSKFKEGKTKRELVQLLSQFDDEFDVLPPFPDIQVTEANTAPQHQSEAITIDDDEDDVVPAPKTTKTTTTTTTSATVESDVLYLSDNDNDEPIESVCRRVSLGLGLLSDPIDLNDSDDDEEEEPNTPDSPIRKTSPAKDDDDMNDSFFVSDDDEITDGTADYEYKSGDEDNLEDSIEFDEESDDISMKERTPFTVRKKSTTFNYDSDYDENLLDVMDTPKRQLNFEDNGDAMDTNDDWMVMSPAPQQIAAEEDSTATSDNNHHQQQYIQLLGEARSFELSGRLTKALALYMQALDLNDSDDKLHCKICCLASKLNLR